VARFNENHEPAGSDVGGQFAPADGGSGGSGESENDKADHTRRLKDAKDGIYHHLTSPFYDNIDDETKVKYVAAASGAFDKMTPGELKRFTEQSPNWKFYASTDEVTKELKSRFKSLKNISGVGGAFEISGDGKTGTLHLDGQGSKIDDNTIDHIYQHEFSHVLDGKGDVRLSNNLLWQVAWKSELKGGSLTKYAAVNRSEGWAEFGRAMMNDRKATTAAYPMCATAWNGYLK
jgi:hypothetical protein